MDIPIGLLYALETLFLRQPHKDSLPPRTLRAGKGWQELTEHPQHHDAFQGVDPSQGEPIPEHSVPPTACFPRIGCTAAWDAAVPISATPDLGI